MVAKMAFSTTTWWSMRFADQVIGPATTRGIAVRALGQHVGEALGEHGRLELQDAVQHPDDAEGELELAARIERGDVGGVSGPGGGPGLSAADREALAHVTPPLRN